MIIGFIGDVHGHVYEAIAAAVTWQMQTGKRFDLLLQVGDLGAFPDPAQMDAATSRYLAVDPAQLDFSHLLAATGVRAEYLLGIRKQLCSPIYFVRGNHEDFAWLAALPIAEETKTAPVDRFGLFRYVPDGTVLEFDEVRIACLGRVEKRTDSEPAGIDRTAYETLLEMSPGSIDVLVTHQGPYGIGRGFRGQVQGSRLMTQLIEHLQPAFHLGGHLHHLNGPLTFGPTTYLGLNGLTPSARWHPEQTGLQPGCLAVLDTEAQTLSPVTDPWLSRFPTPVDFEAWAGGLTF
ncbi:MAG: hypothetical protein CL878_15640 [Dehalococcoidia bacterium]|nr:hypothetical protein [Dehalococcoidia bacterium]